MRKRIQQLHYESGHGVPITDSLHKEFHSIYGKNNNSAEQFIEFARSKGKDFKLIDKFLVKM